MAKKHILVIADGRSPTAQSWIKSLLALDYDVSLISSYPCEQLHGLSHFFILPLAFSNILFKNTDSKSSEQLRPESNIRTIAKKFTRQLIKIRYYLGPISVLFSASKLRKYINLVQPDIVHALRIPFEGMAGRFTPKHIPFVVSSWGNDFTLHANASFLMRSMTKACLKRANGFMADAQNDIDIAYQWGLACDKPTLLVPGSSGINLETISGISEQDFNVEQYNLPGDKPWIINPRGFRPGYIHNDTFFGSIPLVLKEKKDVIFIAPALAGLVDHPVLHDPDFSDNLYLLPKLSQTELWALFKRCIIMVSPSSHDGTPNSLLEALVCGCFPIAGDIKSVREWITPGENGLLIDPLDPGALAKAILKALAEPGLIKQAQDYNMQLAKTRAGLVNTRPKIKSFYENLLNK